MTRALLIGLCAILLLPLDAATKGLPGAAVWREHKVVIHDYTGPEWSTVIRAQVAAFNAMLPKKAPRLVYRAHLEQPCPAIRGKLKRGITTCLVAERDGFLGDAIYKQFRRAILHHVRIPFRPHVHETQPAQTACHEFMHALTGIHDVDRDVLFDGPYAGTSCVWGDELEAPGTFDAAYARRVYRKYDRKEHRQHHGKHKHHGHHGRHH